VPPSIRLLECQRWSGTRRNCSFYTFSIPGGGSVALRTYRKCKGILLKPSSTHMRVRLLLMLNTFRTGQLATESTSQGLLTTGNTDIQPFSLRMCGVHFCTSRCCQALHLQQTASVSMRHQSLHRISYGITGSSKQGTAQQIDEQMYASGHASCFCTVANKGLGYAILGIPCHRCYYRQCDVEYENKRAGCEGQEKPASPPGESPRPRI
jgi:hypothetical protein